MKHLNTTFVHVEQKGAELLIQLRLKFKYNICTCRALLCWQRRNFCFDLNTTFVHVEREYTKK